MARALLVLILCCSVWQANAQQSLLEQANETHDRMIKYYPALQNARVTVKVKNRGSAMAASYSWWSLFVKPNKRKYYVKLNQHVKGDFMCFQFDHLSDSAQNGVMGHELAHVDFFHSLNFFGFLNHIFHQALPNGLKKSERATDYHAIQNGLGHELKTWSDETRTRFLESAGEDIPEKYSSRYLTPTEIDSVMMLFPDLY